MSRGVSLLPEQSKCRSRMIEPRAGPAQSGLEHRGAGEHLGLPETVLGLAVTGRGRQEERDGVRPLLLGSPSASSYRLLLGARGAGSRAGGAWIGLPRCR